MAAVQSQRARLKQSATDVWSIKERLGLASSVLRSGDQNWVSVSRAIKPLGEPNRPADWFSQKNCALQYSDLLEKAETPKRKRGERDIDTPGDVIVRKLTQERVEELERLIVQDQQLFKKLKQEIDEVRTGEADDRLQEIWDEISEEKRAKEKEAENFQKWLLEREAAKQAAALALRVGRKTPIRRTSGRQASDQGSEPDLVENSSAEDLDSCAEEPLAGSSTLSVATSSPLVSSTSFATTPSPTLSSSHHSPLLNTLLRSSSHVSQPTTQSGPKEISPRSQSSLTSPTISSLLSSPNIPTSIASSVANLLTTALSGPPDHDSMPVHPRPPITSPSQGAPTLLKLLDMPLGAPGKLPPLPVFASLPSPYPCATPQVASGAPAPDLDQALPDIPVLATKVEIPDEPGEVGLPPEPRIEAEEGPRMEAIEEVEVCEADLPLEGHDEVVVEVMDVLEIKEHLDDVGLQEEEVFTEIVHPAEDMPSEVQIEVESDKQDIVEVKAEVEVKIEPEEEQRPKPEEKVVHEEHVKAAEATGASVVAPPPVTEEEIWHKSPEHVEISNAQLDSCQINPTEETAEKSESSNPEPSPAVLDIEPEETSPVSESVSDVPTEDSAKPEPVSLKTEEPVDDIPMAVSVPAEIEHKDTSSSSDSGTHPPKTLAENTPKASTTEDEDEDSAMSDVVTPKSDPSRPGSGRGTSERGRRRGGRWRRGGGRGMNRRKPQPTSCEEDDKSGDAEEEKTPGKPAEESEASKDAAARHPTEEVHAKRGRRKREQPEKDEDNGARIGGGGKEPLKKDEDRDRTGEKRSREEQSGESLGRETDEESKDGMVGRSLLSSDSIPNSPASTSMSGDDPENVRDYKLWKKAIMLLWRAVANHKYANVFLHPVTEEMAPGYHIVVYRPMHLMTIKKNIENGAIKTTAEFQRDVMLMFQNAIMYNNSDHDVYKMAIEMQKEVVENIKDFLHTQLLVQSSGTKMVRRETREHSQKRGDDVPQTPGVSQLQMDVVDLKRKRTPNSESEGGKTKRRRTRADD